MAASPHLRDFDFVDLYIGNDFTDVKGLPGAHASRSPLPQHFEGDVAQVRAKCEQLYRDQGEPEFALFHDEVLYRVTAMHDMNAAPVYFVRRMAAAIREFKRLGLPDPVRDFLLAPKTRGLIVIAGEMAVGKTTTAASLLVERLRQIGGVALAIEDPPETRLDGLHGDGRCFQIPVARKHGGYREQLRLGMRSGVSTLLIGEIRCRDTATEAIKQSVNGLTVISTVHAKEPGDALSRIIALAGTDDLPNPAEILSSGIACVIHQKIERHAGALRPVFTCLAVDGQDESAIRTTIRNNQLVRIPSFVDAQQRRHTWN